MFSRIKNKLKAFIIKTVQEYEQNKTAIQRKKIASLISSPSDFKFRQGLRIKNLQNNSSMIKIGEETVVDGELLIFASGGKIEIGNNTYIGEGTRIWSAKSVKIGDNVLVSHNCNIIDTNSHELNYIERAEGFRRLKSEGFDKYNRIIESDEIIIEDYAWLSFNVSILKGVRVGKGAILGANSVVTSNIPDFCLAVGNPAKIIKTDLDKI